MLQPTFSQTIIGLPMTVQNDEVQWQRVERQYHSTIWDNPVVTNVSIPTLTVYEPAADKRNGTSVVICPGGGLYALSIESEGTQVAEWLAERGVTAFVLKYRLVPTGEDGTLDIMNDGAQVSVKAGKVLPMATSDALHAIDYVRMNAPKYNLAPNQIGLMGFSAGGAVTMSATYNYTTNNRPDFIAPVYAWMDVVTATPMPEDAPPIFVACASDDPLMLAPASVKLFNEWLGNGKKAELHMYARGGHGFGMKKQNLPSDKWIEHFGEWLDGEGLMD
ncbi:MAG: acetyl esterase/lipase [Saprospiraceae bacterium]|jgi:acetyl esterase/lipase